MDVRKHRCMLTGRCDMTKQLLNMALNPNKSKTNRHYYKMREEDIALNEQITLLFPQIVKTL